MYATHSTSTLLPSSCLTPRERGMKHRPSRNESCFVQLPQDIKGTRPHWSIKEWNTSQGGRPSPTLAQPQTERSGARPGKRGLHPPLPIVNSKQTEEGRAPRAHHSHEVQPSAVPQGCGATRPSHHFPSSSPPTSAWRAAVSRCCAGLRVGPLPSAWGCPCTQGGHLDVRTLYTLHTCVES